MPQPYEVGKIPETKKYKGFIAKVSGGVVAALAGAAGAVEAEIPHHHGDNAAEAKKALKALATQIAKAQACFKA